MDSFLDAIRDTGRRVMYVVAKGLNRLTLSKLHPHVVTFVGLLAHVPIAYLIAVNRFWWAAILLVIFGLFDALDGGLAKVQNRTSNTGMLLDASTDRMKEVLLYSGIAYAISAGDRPRMAAWAVAACGASLCVSYVKAKGETAVKDAKLTPNEVNRLFSDGLFRFEIRMLVLVIGLLSDRLILAAIVIAICSGLTAIGRLIRISSKLREPHVQS
jgi:phosphatidylglycerophosphate synthase